MKSQLVVALQGRWASGGRSVGPASHRCTSLQTPPWGCCVRTSGPPLSLCLETPTSWTPSTGDRRGTVRVGTICIRAARCHLPLLSCGWWAWLNLSAPVYKWRVVVLPRITRSQVSCRKDRACSSPHPEHPTPVSTPTLFPLRGSASLPGRRARSPVQCPLLSAATWDSVWPILAGQ